MDRTSSKEAAACLTGHQGRVTRRDVLPTSPPPPSQVEVEAAAGPEPAAARVGGAVWVAAGIFLSRIVGLVRERALAHFLGTSAAAGAFATALRIPNFLQNLFGEGVLAGSFIPVYA